MSTTPKRLLELADYWRSKGGRFLGTVGDTNHCSGYHLGKDRIYGDCACQKGGECQPGQGAADYSVKTKRDQGGLSDAASAIDLGRLDGTLQDLRDFSKWLVARANADAPGTSDIRDIVYSLDGQKVLGWSREAGVPSEPIPGYGDSSHLTHTHVSFYRDSESRDKVGLFRPYFEERDMPKIVDYLPGYVATIASDDNFPIRSDPRLVGSNIIRNIGPDKSETWITVGWVRGQKVQNSPRWLARWHKGRWEYVHKRHVADIGAPVGGQSTASLESRLATIKAKIAAIAEDVADD